MQRFFLLLAAAFGLYFGGRWLHRAFSSDESLIRAQLERMAGGVDDGSIPRILGGFDAERYVDTTSGFRTEELRSALLYLFFQQRMDLEAEFDPADGIELTIDPDADPPRATVRFHCIIEERLPDGTSRPWWDLRGVGEMERRGGDWRFVRSSEVDHSTRVR